MAEFNYFPINLEKKTYQIPTNDTSENKQLTLKSPTIKFFVYATFFSVIIPTLNNKPISEISSTSVHHLSTSSALQISMNKKNIGLRIKSAKTIDVNKLIEEKQKEIEKMQNEINKPIIKFENFVIRLGFFMTVLFLMLSLPSLLGYPSFIGVFMSLGLPIFVKIRKWERGE